MLYRSSMGDRRPGYGHPGNKMATRVVVGAETTTPFSFIG